MRLSDWVIGLILAVWGVLVILEAQTFPAFGGQLYGAAFFPTIVGGGLAAIGLAMAVKGLAARQPGIRLEAWAKNPKILFRLALPVAATVAFIFLLEPLGFLLTAIGTLLVMQLALGVRPLLAVAVSVAGAFAVQYAFGTLLRVALPYGPLEMLLL